MSTLPVLSYSALNAYQTCPRRFHHMYVLKDLPREEKSKEQLEGTAVHEAFKKRIRLNEPFPEKYSHYEALVQPVVTAPQIKWTEQKFGMTRDGKPCDFFADNVWLRGLVDLALVESPTAILLDWKTGKTWEDPFELEIQALLLSTAWPDVKTVKGHYVWLRGAALGTEHDCSDMIKTLGKVLRIEESMRRRLISGEWHPDEGPLCGWCPVTKDKCEHKRERRA
jgi:hypothetical protein